MILAFNTPPREAAGAICARIIQTLSEKFDESVKAERIKTPRWASESRRNCALEVVGAEEGDIEKIAEILTKINGVERPYFAGREVEEGAFVRATITPERKE